MCRPLLGSAANRAPSDRSMPRRSSPWPKPKFLSTERFARSAHQRKHDELIQADDQNVVFDPYQRRARGVATGTRARILARTQTRRVRTTARRLRTSDFNKVRVLDN